MFVHDGVLIKKDLSAAIRERLVTDTYDRIDRKTGRINVYRRVSYYDPKKKFNVSAGTMKIGERDPETGKVTNILRRQSPERAAAPARQTKVRAASAAARAQVVADNGFSVAFAIEAAVVRGIAERSLDEKVTAYWASREGMERRWGLGAASRLPSPEAFLRLQQIIKPTILSYFCEQWAYPRRFAQLGANVAYEDREEGAPDYYCEVFASVTKGGLCFSLPREVHEEAATAAWQLGLVLSLSGTVVTFDESLMGEEQVENWFTVLIDGCTDFCLALDSTTGSRAAKLEALFAAHPEAMSETVRDSQPDVREVVTTYLLPATLLAEDPDFEYFKSFAKQVVERTTTDGRKSVKETRTQYFATTFAAEVPGVLQSVRRATREAQCQVTGRRLFSVDWGRDLGLFKNCNYTHNALQIQGEAFNALCSAYLTTAGDLVQADFDRLASVGFAALKRAPEKAGEIFDRWLLAKCPRRI